MPKTIDELEEENERTAQEVSLAEKRVLIAKAKQKYGTDWRKFMPKVHSGFDWNAIKFRV